MHDLWTCNIHSFLYVYYNNNCISSTMCNTGWKGTSSFQSPVLCYWPSAVYTGCSQWIMSHRLGKLPYIKLFRQIIRDQYGLGHDSMPSISSISYLFLLIITLRVNIHNGVWPLSHAVSEIQGYMISRIWPLNRTNLLVTDQKRTN